MSERRGRPQLIESEHKALAQARYDLTYKEKNPEERRQQIRRAVQKHRDVYLGRALEREPDPSAGDINSRVLGVLTEIITPLEHVIRILGERGEFGPHAMTHHVRDVIHTFRAMLDAAEETIDMREENEPFARCYDVGTLLEAYLEEHPYDLKHTTESVKAQLPYVEGGYAYLSVQSLLAYGRCHPVFIGIRQNDMIVWLRWAGWHRRKVQRFDRADNASIQRYYWRKPL